MKEAVKTFLTSIKEREHILKLIHHTDFSLLLVNGAESISLSFTDGKILLENRPARYEISGDIPRLLEGKEPLRALLRKGHIKISAPFRILLLLEAVFYLAKERQSFQKII